MNIKTWITNIEIIFNAETKELDILDKQLNELYSLAVKYDTPEHYSMVWKFKDLVNLNKVNQGL